MKELPKLLIIDDEPSVCETLKIMLSDLFDITYFTDLATARNYLKQNPEIKIMILDYIVNRESGIDFYRNDIINKFDIPTILISGFIGQANTTEEETKALEEMFIKILEKPFDILELREFLSTNILQTAN